MRFQSTGNCLMHRCAVSANVAAGIQKCVVDRADRYPASMISLNAMTGRG
jgi:hypothetical protein